MKIRELYADESRWGQNSQAKTEDGRSTNVFQDDAYSFCLIGAVRKCYSSDLKTREVIYRKLFDAVHGADSSVTIGSGVPYFTEMLSEIMAWNDNPTRTFYQVQHLINKLDI